MKSFEAALQEWQPRQCLWLCEACLQSHDPCLGPSVLLQVLAANGRQRDSYLGNVDATRGTLVCGRAEATAAGLALLW